MVAQLAFMLSLVLSGTAILVFAASELYGRGYRWADQVCNGAPTLCTDPTSIAGLAGAVVVVYFIFRQLEV